jgi:23S rRNA (guanosine2251-2'-O)-methyltransferase
VSSYSNAPGTCPIRIEEDGMAEGKWSRGRNARPGSRSGRQVASDGRPRATGGLAHRRSGDEPTILYGWHTVTAALANPTRRFRRLLATENAMRRIAVERIDLPLAPELVRPDVIAARLGADAVHQGLYAEADPLSAPGVDDLSPDGIVLALDQITDPHNVGAILRSAAAFGVAAVVITARHSPEATGVLAKAASGALEHVPLVAVQNLARALAGLKERGFLLVGLDSTGANEMGATPLRAPLVLVLGAEGKGLRQLTRASCDIVAHIELPGAIKSLNVSNAAALALYVASAKLRGGQPDRADAVAAYLGR